MADNSCAKCGACTAVCPVYQVTGQESLTARGRLHLLERIGTAKHSRAYLDIFSKCLLCAACHQVCPREIDLPAKVVESRSNSSQLTGQGYLARALVKNCLSHQTILTGLGKLLRISAPLLDKIPADSGLRLKLGLPAPELRQWAERERESPGRPSPTAFPELLLFPGCFARHLNPAITSAATSLVHGKEGHQAALPKGQGCCGLAFHSSGQKEQALDLARLNIAAFEETVAPIIVLCGSCYSHLASYPALLASDLEWLPRAVAFTDRLRELSAFLAPPAAPGPNQHSPRRETGKNRVVYHDPCHLRYQKELGMAARSVLTSLPWVELLELPGGPRCCGFGGLFNLAHPDISGQIAGNLVQDILAVDPDLVVTTCSGCLLQLRKFLAAAGSRCQVRHLAEILTSQPEPTTSSLPASF